MEKKSPFVVVEFKTEREIPAETLEAAEFEIEKARMTGIAGVYQIYNEAREMVKEEIVE